MPRKPNLGPIVLKVESLTNGQSVDDAMPLVDDFTGEVILKSPRVQAQTQPPRSAQDTINDHNATKARIAGVMLRRVGITKGD